NARLEERVREADGADGVMDEHRVGLDGQARDMLPHGVAGSVIVPLALIWKLEHEGGIDGQPRVRDAAAVSPAAELEHDAAELVADVAELRAADGGEMLPDEVAGLVEVEPNE